MTARDQSPFISADELAVELAGSSPPVLLDVRFDPGKPGARQRYLDGHVPGAIYVDLPTELADGAAVGRGSNPLPDSLRLEADLRRWGLSNDSHVVVYDDTSGAPAARAWWTLTWAGLSHVRVLDGGLAAWRRRQGALASRDEWPPAAGYAAVRSGRKASVDADGVLAFVVRGALVDTRPAAAYGTGHIPGAKSVPIGQLVDADGRLLPAVTLRERLADGGVDLGAPIAAYCGGGVASAFFALALSRLGVGVTLYPGSWSDWITDPHRPIEA
jgi:thiosulfate/3-mercaptopyruvate sulfurtransferase